MASLESAALWTRINSIDQREIKDLIGANKRENIGQLINEISQGIFTPNSREVTKLLGAIKEIVLPEALIHKLLSVLRKQRVIQREEEIVFFGEQETEVVSINTAIEENYLLDVLYLARRRVLPSTDSPSNQKFFRILCRHVFPGDQSLYPALRFCLEKHVRAFQRDTRRDGDIDCGDIDQDVEVEDEKTYCGLEIFLQKGGNIAQLAQDIFDPTFSKYEGQIIPALFSEETALCLPKGDFIVGSASPSIREILIEQRAPAIGILEGIILKAIGQFENADFMKDPGISSRWGPFYDRLNSLQRQCFLDGLSRDAKNAFSKEYMRNHGDFNAEKQQIMNKLPLIEQECLKRGVFEKPISLNLFNILVEEDEIQILTDAELRKLISKTIELMKFVWQFMSYALPSDKGDELPRHGRRLPMTPLETSVENIRGVITELRRVLNKLSQADAAAAPVLGISSSDIEIAPIKYAVLLDYLSQLKNSVPKEEVYEVVENFDSFIEVLFEDCRVDDDDLESTFKRHLENVLPLSLTLKEAIARCDKLSNPSFRHKRRCQNLHPERTGLVDYASEEEFE